MLENDYSSVIELKLHSIILFKGESTRLMAWLVKNSRSEEVMRNIIRADGIPHLVAMATSEHVVMQNESLVAVTLMASTVLGNLQINAFY